MKKFLTITGLTILFVGCSVQLGANKPNSILNEESSLGVLPQGWQYKQMQGFPFEIALPTTSSLEGYDHPWQYRIAQWVRPEKEKEARQFAEEKNLLLKNQQAIFVSSRPLQRSGDGYFQFIFSDVSGLDVQNADIFLKTISNNEDPIFAFEENWKQNGIEIYRADLKNSVFRLGGYILKYENEIYVLELTDEPYEGQEGLDKFKFALKSIRPID